MTLNIFETIQRIVQHELGRVRTAEIAVVQEQHPHASDSDTDNYSCTVALRDTGLVLKQVPVATQRIGGVSIPSVGEMVLVQFVGGDMNAPVITGRLYNDEDRPPANDDGQAILHLPLGAGDDDAVHLEIHSGESREIILKLGSGIEIQIKDDDPVVDVVVDGGAATIQVDRDGAIKIESQGDLEIKGNNVSVEAQAELNLKAGAAANVSGQTVNLN